MSINLTLSEQKQRIRRQLLKRRLLLTAAEKQQAAQQIAAQLMRIPTIRSSQYLAVYDAFKGELSLEAFLKQRLAFPPQPVYFLPIPTRQAGVNDLMWSVWHPGQPMKKGIFGITEPIPSQWIHPPQETVFLIPIVGFTVHCDRLGYGKGFYDYFLHRIQSTPPYAVRERAPRFFGIAYDNQKIEWLPTEAHDYPLDAIVTPHQVYWQSGQTSPSSQRAGPIR